MDDTLKFLADFQTREAAGNRCLLCGKEYTDADYEGAIFVGEGYLGRSVHAVCWVGFRLLCARLELDWQAAVERKRAERVASIPPLGKRPTPPPAATE